MTCIEHTHGDTFTKSLAFTDSVGTAIDLTGSTITFSIKKNKTDTSYSAQATASITAGTGGTATITIDPLSIAIGDYWYDLQWVDSDGDIKTPLKGQFLVTYDITT